MNIQNIVENPHELTVDQFAELFIMVLGAFDDHGRKLAEKIDEILDGDRDSFAEGLAWLEDDLIQGAADA